MSFDLLRTFRVAVPLLTWGALLLQPGCAQECQSADDCAAGRVCRSGDCVPSNNRAQTPPPAVWKDRATGFLWKIEGETPSYLLGTIHVGVDPAGFPASVWGTFDDRPLLAIEVDVRAPVDQATLGRYNQLPADLSLDALVPSDVWMSLVRDLSLLIPERDLRRLEPWYVSALLGSLSSIGLPAMEPALLRRAADQRKALDFMETVDEQLGALQRTPRQTWIEDLTNRVRDPTAARVGQQYIVDAYLRGDATAIAELFEDTDPDLHEHLLRGRNERWIPKILGLHQSGGAFIAVGAAHLLGPDNVIDMLRTRGSTVSVVRIDGQPLRSAPVSTASEASPEQGLHPLFVRPWR